MGSPAVAPWAALIQGITQLVEGPTDLTGRTPVYQEVARQFQALLGQPTPPVADWEKFIVEGKVST